LAIRGAVQPAQLETSLICVSTMQAVQGHLHNRSLANRPIQATKHPSLHYASLDRSLCSLPITTLEVPHFLSLRFYNFNLVKCFACFPLNYRIYYVSFPIPFFLTSVLCRSCLVNHIDLEHLFCLEDFLTWDHGQLIWFVLELFCMYLFTSACYLYSMPNRFAAFF
jgi:hypothetical protein